MVSSAISLASFRFGSTGNYRRVKNNDAKVAVMGAYLLSNKGSKNKLAMANAYANRKGRPANKGKVLEAKLKNFTNAFGAGNKNAMDVFKLIAPLGEKTNPKILLNALAWSPPEPETPAKVALQQAQLAELTTNKKKVNAIINAYREALGKEGAALTSNAARNKMRNDKSLIGGPLRAALKGIKVAGANLSRNTFKEFLAAAADQAASTSPPTGKTRANVEAAAKQAAKQAAINQIKNKNWFKNYPNTNKRAQAYLAQPGLNSRKFTNDMALLEMAGTNNATQLRSALVNKPPAEFKNNTVRAKVLALRKNRDIMAAANTAAAAAAETAAGTKWTALGLRVPNGTGQLQELTPAQLTLFKNLANGHKLNNADAQKLAGLNLAKNANKLYALKLLVPKMTATAAGYSALDKSNIEPQYKSLLKAYLDAYTSQTGRLGFGTAGNRTLKANAPYRAITKEEAIKFYKNAQMNPNYVSNPKEAVNFIKSQRPPGTFNWAPARKAISNNAEFIKLNPTVLNYLPVNP
jgi:hypothetical protein